jgi:predicted DNA-binding antitoxin AbrB/MazE fold protein
MVARPEPTVSHAMTQRITAVVEQGRLRPTVPLDLAEGAEVQIIILPAAAAAGEPPQPKRNVKDVIAAIAALPTEAGPEFTGRDHDRILYGGDTAR